MPPLVLKKNKSRTNPQNDSLDEVIIPKQSSTFQFKSTKWLVTVQIVYWKQQNQVKQMVTWYKIIPDIAPFVEGYQYTMNFNKVYIEKADVEKAVYEYMKGCQWTPTDDLKEQRKQRLLQIRQQQELKFQEQKMRAEKQAQEQLNPTPPDFDFVPQSAADFMQRDSKGNIVDFSEMKEFTLKNYAKEKYNWAMNWFKKRFWM